MLLAKKKKILVDNGVGLNVCPLRTTCKLGFKAEDITPATKGMTALDNTHHDALEILIIPLTRHRRTGTSRQRASRPGITTQLYMLILSRNVRGLNNGGKLFAIKE